MQNLVGKIKIAFYGRKKMPFSERGNLTAIESQTTVFKSLKI